MNKYLKLSVISLMILYSCSCFAMNSCLSPNSRINKVIEILNKRPYEKSQKILLELFQNKTPIQFQAQISSFQSALGYSLSQLISQNEDYISFFGNSLLESFDGAIKVARGYHFASKTGKTKVIVFGDENYDFHINPTDKDRKLKTKPNIEYWGKNYNNKNQLLKFSNYNDLGSIVIQLNENSNIEALATLREFCLKNNILFILDESKMQFKNIFQISRKLDPDIVISGENLTSQDFPFGAYSAKEKIWRKAYMEFLSNIIENLSFEKPLKHSSTFGGNAAACEFVLSNLYENSMLDISVVIPIYNEEENIVPLLEELFPILKETGKTHEVICVDDASKDNSFGRMKELEKKYKELKVIRHTINCGESGAGATGFTHAKGEIIITIDGDQQNDPHDIPNLLKELKTADAVCGVRRKREDNIVKKISSRLANGFRGLLLNDDIHDAGCTYRALRKSALKEVPVFNGMHRFLPAILKFQGYIVKETLVNDRPRTRGVSKYGIGNRLFRGLLDCVAMLWFRKRCLPGKRI